MQWRRGLAFAAVHLAVLLPIVVSLEVDDAAMIRQHQDQAQDDELADPIPARPISSSEASNDRFIIDLCSMTDIYAPHEEMILIADPIAATITGWRSPCPSFWSISGIWISTVWEPPTPVSFAKQQIVDAIFLLLVAIQWLLIGGFPLRPQLGLWRDPATLVTLFTVASAALSLIPGIGPLATFPSLFAAIAWLWWFALLAWKLLRSGWNSIAARRRGRVPDISI